MMISHAPIGFISRLLLVSMVCFFAHAVYGMQPGDVHQHHAKALRFNNTAYVEAVSGTQYETLLSLTQHVSTQTFMDKVRKPIPVGTDFFELINPVSSADPQKMLRTQNTIQQAIQPLLDRWLKIQSVSESAAQEYSNWMKARVPELIERTQQHQQQKLLAVADRYLKHCQQELARKQVRLQDDMRNHAIAVRTVDDVTSRMFLKASVATGAAAGISAWLDSAACSMSVVGVYGYYLAWQFGQYRHMLRWYTMRRRELETKMLLHENRVTLLSDRSRVQNIVDAVCAQHAQSALEASVRSIDRYQTQQVTKITRWRYQQDALDLQGLTLRCELAQQELTARNELAAAHQDALQKIYDAQQSVHEAVPQHAPEPTAPRHDGAAIAAQHQPGGLKRYIGGFVRKVTGRS